MVEGNLLGFWGEPLVFATFKPGPPSNGVSIASSSAAFFLDRFQVGFEDDWIP